MAKIVEQKINDFSKGIISNPRIEDTRYCQYVKNFDIHTFPKKLVPFRDMVSGDALASTQKIRNFCIALRTGATYSLYGLGVTPTTDRNEIYYKNLTASGTNDLADANWTETTNNADATGTTGEFDLFCYYKKTGLIYGSRDKRYIWEYDPAGSISFNASKYDYGAGLYSTITQGLIHSKDDIMYFGINNKVIKNDNGTFSVALTLPTHYKITSVSEYGNYLSIAVAPLSGFGNSKVYIWDRDSSLTTLTESVDWGEGSLAILEEIEGFLLGISSVGYPSSFKGKIIFRQYSGGQATVFNPLIVDTSIVIDQMDKQKVNQYLYFLITCGLNGKTIRALWKIGRQTPNDPFSLSVDRFAYNDTTITPTTGFFVVGDYVFISYTDVAGTAHSMAKTNSTASYTATSIYESLILNGGDSRLKKKLLGVTVTTEFLPADGQVVLKYQIDENIGGTTWITIFTNTTDNSISYSAVNSLPEYKEIVFRIESTGGAVITGLEYKTDILGKDIYD